VKSRRFQFAFRDNASSLHRTVGNILRSEAPFSGYRSYQEWPVSRINPKCKNSKLKFDWVIPELYLVIECHGKQHYEKTSFGGIDSEKAEKLFKEQQERDRLKMEYAIEMGWTYIVIPYTLEKSLTANIIWRLYKDNYNDKRIEEKPIEKEDPTRLNRLQKAKEYRHQQYLINKNKLNRFKQEKRSQIDKGYKE
jgi:very-short-patch-repair endonuclease